jgi:hypothetical protein
MSAVLKVISHSNILWRKGGPFYSLHDWLTRHGAVFGLPMGERYGVTQVNGYRHTKDFFSASWARNFFHRIQPV